MSDLTARIVLWGIEGAGKSTTLQTIYTKLRPDLRGTLRREPSRLDPTVHAEILPIILGPVGGVGSAIEIVAVPGASDQRMTRKQLLDRVDGIVLVLDCSPEKIDANSRSIDELRDSLADYGRTLEEIPVVLQYNKRDIADPFAIEALHRRLGFGQSAVFETIATTGQGILPALTTISKHVVRSRRALSQSADGDSKSDATAPLVATQRPTPAAPPAPVPPHARATHEILEAGILNEGEAFATDADPDAIEQALSRSPQPPSWERNHAPEAKPDASLTGDLRIVSVGQADLEGDGQLRLPLVLGDAEGRTRSVVLSLRLDPLPGPDRD